MTLIIIKLGDKEYNGKKGDEGFELLHFLNLLMYPHKEDFIEKISYYIDFSDNEELWKEAPHMFSLSQCIYGDGLEEGKEQGIEQGIQYLINVVEEFGGTMEMVVQQLMKKYGLDETNAQEKVYMYW